MRFTFLSMLLMVTMVVSVSAQTGTGTDSSKSSTGSIYTGISNGYFSPKSSSNSFSQLNWNIGGSYTHSSGLGIAVSSYITQDKNRYSIYQTAFTPSFDYSFSDKWGAGISYTHYFTKDSVSFDLSPLKNEFYGYLSWKDFFLSPTLAVNYAYGTEKDVLQTQRRTITKSVSVHDINYLLTISHGFELGSMITDEDGITFTPSVQLVYGSNTYGANIISGKLPRFTTNKRAAKLAQALASPTNTAAWQYATITLDFYYAIGKFFLEPQIIFDYTIPRTESRWNSLVACSAGFSF